MREDLNTLYEHACNRIRHYRQFIVDKVEYQMHDDSLLFLKVTDCLYQSGYSGTDRVVSWIVYRELYWIEIIKCFETARVNGLADVSLKLWSINNELCEVTAAEFDGSVIPISFRESRSALLAKRDFIEPMLAKHNMELMLFESELSGAYVSRQNSTLADYAREKLERVIRNIDNALSS